MTVDFEKSENVNVRLRKRRRMLEANRRSRASARMRGPLAIIVICLIAGLTGYIGAHDGQTADTGLSYSVYAEEKVNFKNIVVKSGDTIWGIASKYTEPSKDIRKTVREICRINEIKPENIYPGQVIRVPVPASLA
jgi:LysM repeat protein